MKGGNSPRNKKRRLKQRYDFLVKGYKQKRPYIAKVFLKALLS
jgi:hypothetical protein